MLILEKKPLISNLRFHLEKNKSNASIGNGIKKIRTAFNEIENNKENQYNKEVLLLKSQWNW